MNLNYTGIRGGLLIVGLGIAAFGAAMHVVINYHERAYAVFLVGMLCILGSVGIDFLKNRNHGNHGGITLPSLPNSLLIVVGLLITAADLFLFRMHTHMKTSAAIAFGTALLLACACVGLMIWQARHHVPLQQKS